MTKELQVLTPCIRTSVCYSEPPVHEPSDTAVYLAALFMSYEPGDFCKAGCGARDDPPEVCLSPRAVEASHPCISMAPCALLMRIWKGDPSPHWRCLAHAAGVPSAGSVFAARQPGGNW